MEDTEFARQQRSEKPRLGVATNDMDWQYSKERDGKPEMINSSKTAGNVFCIQYWKVIGGASHRVAG